MRIEEVLQNQRLNEWGQMVQACRSSGKSVSAWCSENDINEKTYYYRQRRVCVALPANRETRPVESQIAFAEVPPVCEYTDVAEPRFRWVVSQCSGKSEPVLRNDRANWLQETANIIVIWDEGRYNQIIK